MLDDMDRVMPNKARAATRLCILCALLLAHPAHVRAEQSFVFASVDDGRRILTTRDTFVERMSPFDRAARMKTDRAVSESEYLAFVGKHVLEWNSSEITAIRSVLDEISPALSRLFPAVREPVYLVKTTGEEDSKGALYTRGYGIVLPRTLMHRGRDLRGLLAHEFFHIVSRNHPTVRKKLHEAIGFDQCGEVELPPALRLQKITNPDAPIHDHCIRVGVGGESVWVMPILYSRTPKYDTRHRGEFLDYLQFALMVVERSGVSAPRPVLSSGNPELLRADKVSGFFEQVGRNTNYIIDPEEILADNVALLVLGEKNVRSPDVLARIAQALAQARAAELDPAHRAASPRRSLQ